MVESARKVGIISDTHGLLRPEAVRALEGSDFIIHAGDIGHLEIIESLQKIAPTVAVRGNIDKEPWASQFPNTAVAEIGEVYIYVIHDIKALGLNPRSAGFSIVVGGHSHKPAREERDGVLYLNPGSAGPRRFSLPVTLIRLDLAKSPWKTEFVNLVIPSAASAKKRTPQC